MPLRPKLSALLIPFLLVVVRPVPAATWMPSGFDPSFGRRGGVLSDVRCDTFPVGVGQVVDVRQRIVVATTRSARTCGRGPVPSRYPSDGALDRSVGQGAPSAAP
jgi:hypothetical protein